MKTTAGALMAMAAFAGHAAAHDGPRTGYYATSKADCAALVKQDPAGKLDTGDIVGGSVDAAGGFLVVERATLGSADFECKIGKARKSGKAKEWPLTCAGESSGGAKSAVLAGKSGTLIFSGGLAGWGTTYFCR